MTDSGTPAQSPAENSTATTATTPAAHETFEDVLRRLGEVVAKLEGGNLTLEDSLRAFELGVSLARDAQARLDAAEARVDELLSVDDQGRAVSKPVATTDDQEAARRSR